MFFVLYSSQKFSNEKEIPFLKKNFCIVLTISTHSRGHAFFQTAVLTSIAVDSLNCALLIFSARSIVDFLLDGAAEKSLKKNEKF